MSGTSASTQNPLETLRSLVARWQPGDLILFSEIQQALSAAAADPHLGGPSSPMAASLRQAEAHILDLLDDGASAGWMEALTQGWGIGAAIPVDAAADAQPAAFVHQDGLYPADYFDHVIDDPKMLGQLCDEVKEHMDIAQYTLVDLEYDSTNPEMVNKLFRAFHTIKSSAAFLGLKNIEESAHAIEDLMVLVRDGAIPVDKDLINVIFFGVGFLKDLVGIIEASGFQREPLIESFRRVDIDRSIAVFRKIHGSRGSRRIGQILQDEGILDSSAVAAILEQQAGTNRKFGEIAVEGNFLTEEELRASLHRQEASGRNSTFVKVSNDRLNSLIDIVGELVVNQSMLRQFLKNPETSREAGERAFAQLESITTNIKNLVLSMGMVPIAEIFHKLRVVIRNTAAETGKSVNVEFHGESTELDRNVIQNIYDPLVHMVRNAVDHGLEDPPTRKAQGKPTVGTIVVNADHKGNSIEITVSDDGRGIDRASVVAKALAQGLITAAQSETLGEKDVYALLMLPGFSTKETVTEVSGRGVGMDVVKQNVDLIHGKIEIRSELNLGSQFTLRIPLTLAIIDGFVTLVDETKYIFPFNVIEQIVVPEPGALTRLDDGQELLFDQGLYTPIISAARVFGHPEHGKERNLVVIISYEQKRYGIAVDAVLGKQEIVIKTLNEALHHLKTFSGGTIFGDGSIGFVVDVDQFILAVREHTEAGAL